MLPPVTLRVMGGCRRRSGGALAAIGTDPSNSTTKLPNHFIVKTKTGDINFYDNPGFNDTRGVGETIANSYYVYSNFEQIPMNKFIVFVKHSTNDTKGLFNALICFLNLFRFGSRDTSSPKKSEPGKPECEKLSGDFTPQNLAKYCLLVSNCCNITSKELV